MRFSHVIQETWRSIRRNIGSYVLAGAVQAICLTLVTIFTVLTINVSQLTHASSRKIEIYAFLADGADVQQVESRSALIEGVAATRYVSKDEALGELQSDLGQDQALADALSENPLPASIRVTVQPGRARPGPLAEIEDKLKLIPGVAEVWSGREILSRLSAVLRTVLILDAAILVIVAVSVVFIVFQTVEGSIVARRHEIQVMELVGATRRTIWLPFLIEGTSQGLLGGIVALLLVIGLRGAAVAVAPVPSFPIGLIAATDVLLGTGLGLAGSLAALNRVDQTSTPNTNRPRH